MCLRLPWQRHAWSALVAHTAGGPLIAVHVQLHFFDNLLNDFITGDGRYSLLHIIQGLQKIRQFLADGSFLVVVTLALRLVLNSKHAQSLNNKKKKLPMHKQSDSLRWQQTSRSLTAGSARLSRLAWFYTWHRGESCNYEVGAGREMRGS